MMTAWVGDLFGMVIIVCGWYLPDYLDGEVEIVRVSFINNVEWNDDDGACKGLTTRFRDMSFDPDSPVRRELEDLANFVSVSSFFYPDLIRWYENEAVEWFVDRLAEIDSMHSV